MAKIVNSQPVNLRETIEVQGIKAVDGVKQILKPGKNYKVHPLAAENLIANGHAVKAEDAPKTEDKKGSKKQ